MAKGLGGTPAEHESAARLWMKEAKKHLRAAGKKHTTDACYALKSAANAATRASQEAAWLHGTKFRAEVQDFYNKVLRAQAGRCVPTPRKSKR